MTDLRLRDGCWDGVETPAGRNPCCTVYLMDYERNASQPSDPGLTVRLQTSYETAFSFSHFADLIKCFFSHVLLLKIECLISSSHDCTYNLIGKISADDVG